MSSMGKAGLVDAVYEEAELDTKAAAQRAVSSVFKVIQDTLAGGGRVTIPGFGSFKTSKRAARTGRNPQTGEPLEIAARTAVSFKAGAGLKDAVN